MTVFWEHLSITLKTVRLVMLTMLWGEDKEKAVKTA
jgi:hypothetical protein